MPRHFDFLSVGEEFGADALGEHLAWEKSAGIASGARSANVQFLMGGITANIRKPNGAMVRVSQGY
jgi:hypothetical protein